MNSNATVATVQVVMVVVAADPLAKSKIATAIVVPKLGWRTAIATTARMCGMAMRFSSTVLSLTATVATVQVAMAAAVLVLVVLAVLAQS